MSALGDVLGDQILLDGELVCFDPAGLPDFARLRSRLRARTSASITAARAAAPATLIVFDVLHLSGRSTRRLPYRQRRELLEELRLDGAAWRTPRTFAIDEDLPTVTRDRHLEGIVAKRLDAPYLPGRRGELWLKYKHRHRERLTVTAWRPGHLREPDELLISRHDADGQLQYAGGVRFGLTAAERVRLRAVLERLEEPCSRRSGVRPVRPVIQADVDYHGRPGGPLRDPVLRLPGAARLSGPQLLPLPQHGSGARVGRAIAALSKLVSSVSLRARSIWASLGPRWWPRRRRRAGSSPGARLVCW